MPKVYLSYPISSPAVLAKEREHVMFIGAGAGIATFLCFVDREFIKSTRSRSESAGDLSIQKVEKPKNKKMDLVFICREIEHMRWMAKYLNAVLTVPEMTDKMRFHIYITVKLESNNISSFLFWRAMIMYNREQENISHRGSSLVIKLGRPNFERFIQDVCIDNLVRTHHIYACGPKVMTKKIEGIVNKSNSQPSSSSKENKTKIIFNYEIF